MCEVCWILFVGLFLVVLCLLKIVNCKRSRNTLKTYTLNSIYHIRQGYTNIMTEEGREMVRGAEGPQPSPGRRDSSIASGETDPLRAPLSILIKVTRVSGEPLPYGEVSVELVEEIFQNCVGVTPLEVLVLNDQDALVDLADGMAITEIAMAIHGEHQYRNQSIRVGCVIAGRENLIAIERERIETRMQREELVREKQELRERQEEARRGEQELLDRQKESKLTVQEESLRMKNEYTNYQLQMNDLTARVQEQLSLLETVRKEIEGEVQHKRRRSRVEYTDERIDKLPIFPLFSGAEPTPKDECGIETFLFQVRGARKNLTDQAVRQALIGSLRGGASGFIEYVGLDSPLDVMIDELVERYCVTATHDTLICKFHQLTQERNERIREFAGRIEKIFKKLRKQIPERYRDKTLLKDRLFHGMHQHLKDSLRYLYTQASVTYSELLQAAYAAEVEAEKGRLARSKAANVAQSPERAPDRSRDPSPIAASVAALESKLDKCLKAVSKAAQTQPNTKGSQRPGNIKRESSSAPATPSKTKGPGMSAAGPFKGKNGKPIRCWRCGGWGHTSRECPTQGNLNWRELNGTANPPRDEVKAVQNN